jgi:Cu-processing system permease protein
MIGLGTYSNEYPIELPVFVLMVLNPLDLLRMVFLVQTDLSQLMGFSAAFAVKTLGGTGGVFLAVGGLIAWVALPLLIALRRFKSKDL